MPARIALPPEPAPADPPPFPVLAAVAPVVVSGALWLLTGSALSLLFAALGPVVAVAALLDGRRSRRRAARRAARRHAEALDRVEERIRAEHDAEAARLRATAPSLVVEAGRGDVASGLELTGEADGPRERALRAAAAVIRDGPVLVDLATGVAVAGPAGLAAAIARRLVVLALVADPGLALRAPAAEAWAADVGERWEPGDADRFVLLRDGAAVARISWGPGTREGAALRIDAHDPATVMFGMSAARARRTVRALPGGVARRAPDAVRLADLLGDASGPPRGLEAPVGADADGPVRLDLERQGPHAIVAGTTGSGKSELLVSWVLGMAATRAPSEVVFVLVDFKGGAAFAPLAGLPHVAGVLSDLDERLAARAVESLSAELRRREEVLARRRARSVAELPAGELPRLVVVVDEYAALVAAHPGLHAAFADLAARGRSLGIHLVLCTQRPAGVVRDGVLANTALRISLRVTDRGESLALLGDDRAARLPARAPGRAVLADGDGPARVIQVALADPATAERIAARWAGVAPAAPTWLPPLPHPLPRSALPAVKGIRLGLADRPDRQAQPVAGYRPDRDGNLLVLGGPGSGRSTALALVAAEAEGLALPSDPAELWRALDSLPRGLVVMDDLDAVLASADPEVRAGLVERLAVVVRDRRRGPVAASARRPDGLLALAPHFPARLLLAQPTREDHVLAGGEGAQFTVRLPPGAGWWRGEPVQVALPEHAGIPPAPLPPVPRVRLGADGVAIVSGRARERAGQLAAAGIPVRWVGAGAAGTGPGDAGAGDAGAGSPPAAVLLGDPDDWNADWSALHAARRELPMLVVDCTWAELRSVGRLRAAAPPLGDPEREGWRLVAGTAERVLVEWGAEPGVESVARAPVAPLNP